ncbi:MAG: ion transporter [Deltaproteobacteria bacterium]|jgi:voltage-gated sodium channel|nr:ion transporter [Deltaproteobacteria bacterium]
MPNDQTTGESLPLEAPTAPPLNSNIADLADERRAQTSPKESIKESHNPKESLEDSNLAGPFAEKSSLDSPKSAKEPSAFIKFCGLIYRPGPERFIIGVIIFNSIILGVETSPTVVKHVGGLLTFLEVLCVAIFCVELSMKIACERLKFFTSAWNIFDFVIVAIALVPSTGKLSVLRSLRILRLNRLIARLPRLRIIVEAIIRSLPSIGWIAFLLVIFFYIFAVLTTTLFGADYPEWFGSLGASMYTLFQMLTLESWSMGIARPVMSTFPYAYLVFVPFILLSSFIVLNMFIGVIVNTIGEVMNEEREVGARAEETEGESGARKAALGTQPDHLAAVGTEILNLKAQLDRIEGLLKNKRD